MNFAKGDTIVVTLTPKAGDIIVDVGYKPAKAPETNIVKKAMEKEIAQMVESAPESPDASEVEKPTYIPAKNADDAPIKKELKVPEGMNDNYFLPMPSPGAVVCLKDRVHRAFSKIYRMEIYEVESLFEFEEMDEVIEENADVFWVMDPKQVAVAIHRRIVGELRERGDMAGQHPSVKVRSGRAIPNRFTKPHVLSVGFSGSVRYPSP